MPARMRQFYHLGTALAAAGWPAAGSSRLRSSGLESPLEMITKVPLRSAAGGSAYGTIAASSTAPASSPGRRSSIAEAMLAPLENPTATSDRPSIPYALTGGHHEFGEVVGPATQVDPRRTLPRCTRRKNRGMPFSSTVPRTESTAAPGDR